MEHTKSNKTEYRKVLTIYNQVIHKIKTQPLISPSYERIAGLACGLRDLFTKYEVTNILAESIDPETEEDKYKHVWNIVLVNKGWYHIDVSCAGFGGYDRFLVADGVLKNTGFDKGIEFLENTLYPQSPLRSFGGTDERRAGRFKPRQDAIFYYTESTGRYFRFNCETSETEEIDASEFDRV